jgi:hypothetical protein
VCGAVQEGHQHEETGGIRYSDVEAKRGYKVDKYQCPIAADGKHLAPETKDYIVLGFTPWTSLMETQEEPEKKGLLRSLRSELL